MKKKYHGPGYRQIIWQDRVSLMKVDFTVWSKIRRDTSLQYQAKFSLYYRPQRSCGKVIFYTCLSFCSQGWGRAWQEGVCGGGDMHGGGRAWQEGVCMAWGRAWQGGMHGGGVHGGGHACQIL